MLVLKELVFYASSLPFKREKERKKLMVCQNCGTQLPDGTPSCPTCGAQMFAPQQPYMDPNQPYTAAPAAPAKKSNGALIGIIVAVVAVIAIVLVAVNLLGGSEYDGKYKLTKCTYMGQEFTISDMEAMMGESYDMTLTVKGSRCTLNSNGETGKGKISFDGDTVTIEDDEETLEGEYDADAKTITINMYGVGMIFELQD